MNIVVLISGNGSNLQAIINAIESGLELTLSAVISNKPNVYGLERARQANIPTHVINHHDFKSRHDFDTALQKQIDQYQPDLIVLAGFMRKLGNDFVRHYAAKIINIHPSLLPKYPGLQTHQKVLTNKDEEHGVTIHFVTEDLDAGPIIAQERLPVRPDDTEESLTDRIHRIEHQLYPAVLKLFSEGRIALQDNTVLLDDQAIDPSAVLSKNTTSQ